MPSLDDIDLVTR
jgi:hypothetical protein